MELNHKENGDKLYTEEKYLEAFEEYKRMLKDDDYKLTPHFNNRFLACCRKSKNLDNYLYAFDLMSEINSDYFDFENYNLENFKTENATTYLWLLYDLIKEDDFNVNLYLQEVLGYLNYYVDRQNYCYFLAKLLIKNQATNKKLLRQFLDFIDFKQYSKDLKYQDGKTQASDYEQLGYWMAKFYNGMGEFEQSNVICDELLTMEQGLSKYRHHILNLQAKNFLALNDINAAIEKKKQAIAVKEDWFLYHQLGLIYLNLNDIKQAGKYFSFAFLKSRQNLGYMNKFLLDMAKVYSEVKEEDLVKLIHSLLYYERKKNDWSINAELENAEKFEITADNFKKYYNDFRYKCKIALKKYFLVSKKEGFIKNINSERRFGFVQDNTGKTYHFSVDAALDNPRELAQNDKVYFELKERFNPKKNIKEKTCEYIIKI